jgi:L-fuculose-phosphate aldolase
MRKPVEELRRDIVEIGRLVYQKGWVAANDGNISIRLDEDRILCTPTRISKGMMAPDDMIVVDMAGNRVEGRRERTSEIAMHLTIYSLRHDIHGVVHAHPPVSTGFAAAGRPLDLALLPEVVISLGCVPLAGYGLPGTKALTAGMMPLIPDYDALLMANHGAVCYGADVWDAFFKMETMEHFARITLVAELLGGAKPLPRREVEQLFKSRERYGVCSHSRMEPGHPRVAEDRNGHRHGERPEVTRDEVLSMIEDALRSRGEYTAAAGERSRD